MSINLIAYEPWVDIGTRTQASHRWGLAATQDLDQVLAQPFRIAIVPAFCSRPDWYLSNTVTHNLDWSLFDLVLIHELEWTHSDSIKRWAKSLCLKSYLIAAGSWYPEYEDDPEVITHQIWMALLVDESPWQDTTASGKKYLFDALLGSRRVHRDYIMYQMQTHPDIRNKTFLTYRSHTYRDNPDTYPLNSRFPNMIAGLRDIRLNRLHTEQAKEARRLLDQPTFQQFFQQRFGDLALWFPYITDDDSVKDTRIWQGIEARSVPWQVFQQTYYTIVTETLHDASGVYVTEKVAKPLYAGRLFVVFSSAGTLARLRAMGFETFSSVIDESYDQEKDVYRRWDLCWQQIQYLAHQPATDILTKVQPILEHNRKLMLNLTERIRAQSWERLRTRIPPEYFSAITRPLS